MKVLVIIACSSGALLFVMLLVRFCTTNPDMRYDSNPYDLTDEFSYKPWYIVLSLIFRSFFRWWWL